MSNLIYNPLNEHKKIVISLIHLVISLDELVMSFMNFTKNLYRIKY